MQNSEFKNWCDEQGRLRVDSTLRLVDVPNVFCAGDMTDIPVLINLSSTTSQTDLIPVTTLIPTLRMGAVI